MLIPYHAAQAFNTWGELNYICFAPNKAISSFIVFFSPFFMPLLFLLAGMSTKYALIPERHCMWMAICVSTNLSTLNTTRTVHAG
jgi:hypothetical protein